jgi:hypothetical protein
MDSHWSIPIVMNVSGLRVHESSVTHDEAMSYALVESGEQFINNTKSR